MGFDSLPVAFMRLQIIIQAGHLACHRVFIRQDSSLLVSGGMCCDMLVASLFNMLWRNLTIISGLFRVCQGGGESVSLFELFQTAVGQICMKCFAEDICASK